MAHKFNHHEYFSGLLLQIKYDAFSIFVDSLYVLPSPLKILLDTNNIFHSQYL